MGTIHHKIAPFLASQILFPRSGHSQTADSQDQQARSNGHHRLSQRTRNGNSNWRTVLLGAVLAFSGAAVAAALGSGSAAQAKEQAADPGQPFATAGAIPEALDAKNHLANFYAAGTDKAGDHPQSTGVSVNV